MALSGVAIAFLVVSVLAELHIGMVFGWGPFASILTREGVYSKGCGAGLDNCDSQAVGLSAVYSYAAAALMFGGLFAGIILDNMGPAFAAGVAGVSVSLGLLLLSILPSGSDGLFIPPFMLLGFGGITVCFTGFRVAEFFPEHKTTLIAAANVLFDASASVPLLLMAGYDLGISRAQLFGSFSAYAAVIFTAWVALWKYYLSLPTPEASWGGGDWGSKPPPPIPPVAADATFTEMVKSKQFLVGWIWFALHQWRANLYLGSVKYMLAYLGDADETYLRIFTGSLFLAVIFIPLIASGADKVGVAGSMQAVTALALVHALCSLVPFLEFQPVTFVVFTLLRASIFTVSTVFVAEIFGWQRLGTVYGIWQTVSAVLNASIPPTTSFVLEHLGGDWSVVLWSYVVICVPQLLAVLYMTKALKPSESSTPPLV